MIKFAKVGEFCQNKSCADYGKEQTKIIKAGTRKKGRQRYKCTTCQGTFTETKGTIFYRRRTAEAEIIDTLALIAEGDRISSLARAKGHKRDTISAWVQAAGQQAEAVEEVLLANYELSRGQIDGLWAYVGHKGEKKTILKRTKGDNSGAQP